MARHKRRGEQNRELQGATEALESATKMSNEETWQIHE